MSDDPDDLVAALAALSSFQQVTQHADAKAGTLLAVHVGMAAVVATNADQWSDVDGAALTVTVALVGCLYVASFFVCGYLLFQAIRPRFATAATDSRFALVRAPSAPDAPGGTPGYAAQAWITAEGVAGIAGLKNRLVGRAVAGTAVMVTTAVLLLFLLAVAGGR